MNIGIRRSKQTNKLECRVRYSCVCVNNNNSTQSAYVYEEYEKKINKI